MNKYAFAVMLALGTLNTTAWADNNLASDIKKMMNDPIKKSYSENSKLRETKQLFSEAKSASKAKENQTDAFSTSKPDACVRPKADVFSQSKADVLSKLKPDTFNK